MGGKKKKPKKKAGEEGDEDPVEVLRGDWKKIKKATELEKIQYKPFDELIDEDALAEADGELKEIYLYEEGIRPEGIRAMMQALIQSNFPQLKSIRIWKCNAYDEGCRMVCNFMNKNTSVGMLDLMGNFISPLGCEFLGKMLAPANNTALKQLKLDHNPIRWKGVAQLARGLSQNATLNELSLDYCEIDHRGGKYLQQILAFIDSNITVVSLQGNKLMEKGIFQIFRALEVNEVLKTINLADNQFGESDPDLLKQMCKTFINPIACGSYDLRYNGIDELAMQKFFNAWQNETSPVYLVQVSLAPINNPEIAQMYKEIMKNIKGRSKKKKGKKGKKGKKKKKKKK